MQGYFFNAQPTTDTAAHPSGYDREYDAEDFNRYMGAFFTNGVLVQDDPDACLVVAASGLKLIVNPGVVLVDGAQCHFEVGDGLTLAGAGKYNIVCRRNMSADVRGFELVAVKGGDSYPPLVREGDIYDMCLARASATDVYAAVGDNRGANSLCGYASINGQPPYYPPDSDNLPYILWLYTLGFPLTEEQKDAVESNQSLMAIYDKACTRPATVVEVRDGYDSTHMVTPKTLLLELMNSRRAKMADVYEGVNDNKFVTPRGLRAALDEDFFYNVGDIVTRAMPPASDSWLPCNGAALTASAYPALEVLGGAFRSDVTTSGSPSTDNAYNRMACHDRTTPKYHFYITVQNQAQGIISLYSYNKTTRAV